MATLFDEARLFAGKKVAEQVNAAQRVAFRLMIGIDMENALCACPAERASLKRRIGRLLERERMRGLGRHWSYDLNRHIALKQALDSLNDGVGEGERPALRTAATGLRGCGDTAASKRSRSRTKRSRYG